MEENLYNISVIENNSFEIDNNTLSNISFNISLFTFIFVVYFLYILLKDFFIKR